MNDLMTRSFLNYVELKKQAQRDIEMGELTQKDEENLANFFDQVEGIKSDMQEISHLLLDLHTLNEETKSTHSAKILRGLRDRMDSDMATVLSKTKTAKARLDGFDNSNAANRVAYPEGSAVDRARVSTTSGLRVKLGEIMNGFHALREKLMADYKDGLRRRYYNVTGEHPSEVVIEEMVSGNGTIQEKNVEERERYEAVMDIWRSLNKLQQAFSDMAVLVEAQGHRIDDIEGNVATATSFVGGGTNSLFYAKQMKEGGKWMCWLWGVGFVIILVCVVAMLTD
ncbi:pantetheine-phosphate adenylyltransferase [Salvia divinorum]|uniref:Pantetheine-phosphate adenylyltransferase n=1 Tax=Salvia divinorum TaxID=28513 RepID=A0ABD1FX12_SALDI